MSNEKKTAEPKVESKPDNHVLSINSQQPKAVSPSGTKPPPREAK